jgi:hypothetical protein
MNVAALSETAAVEAASGAVDSLGGMIVQSTVALALFGLIVARAVIAF